MTDSGHLTYQQFSFDLQLEARPITTSAYVKPKKKRELLGRGSFEEAGPLGGGGGGLGFFGSCLSAQLASTRALFLLEVVFLF